MKLYLAASYRYRAEMRAMAMQLSEAMHIVVSTWHATDALDAIDRDILAEEHKDLAGDVAFRDLQEIDLSDAVLLFADHEEKTRGGKHFESGYAVAHGKELHILGRREHVFHRLPSPFVFHYQHLNDWLRKH